MENYKEVLQHDIRNNLSKAEGYARLLAEKYDGRKMQREAVDEFITAYQRLERVLQEEERFDRRLLEEMREVGPIQDEEVRKWIDSTLLTVDSISALYSVDDEDVVFSDIIDPVNFFGEVYLADGAGDELVPKKYGAIVSTKICDYLQHAGEDAEMFAYASREDGRIETLIGDDGEGIRPEDMEETGRGMEIIEEVTDETTDFRVFTVNEVERLELPEKLEDKEVGALFQFDVPVLQKSTSEL